MDPKKHIDNFTAMFRVDRKIHYIFLQKPTTVLKFAQIIILRTFFAY